jgi:hypothetical protein
MVTEQPDELNEDEQCPDGRSHDWVTIYRCFCCGLEIED